MKDVLFVNPPFVSVSRPAIGVSILKSILTQQGYSCDVGYLNLAFASRLGLDLYSLLDEKVGDALFAGDWLFAQYLFGDQIDQQAYAATLQHYLDPEPFAQVMSMREEIGPFVEHCLEEYRVEEYRVIGFTTTFEQNLASLAISRAIKDRYPDKVVVFGGANCEAEMGMELHRSFNWIDYVCTGEGERAIVGLVDAVLSPGDGDGTIAGFVQRAEDGTSVEGPKTGPTAEMDTIPIPDYDDYFAAIDRYTLRKDLNPSLLIETSRGCWWGAKSHCTFCGLNGETMSFRSKSPDRVMEELRYLKDRHGVHRFMAVDNIIDMAYFRSVLPRLRAEQLGVSLFYETKSNLDKEQVQLLSDSGVRAIQPGVESLNSHVLQLMRKGVTAIQNIQLLKWCKEYGVVVAWNLLYGFPGERQEDYREIEGYIDALYHLDPPHSIGSIRIDRFSPYFNEPESFGLRNIRPFQIYGLLYPLPSERVANLAYFFEYEYAENQSASEFIDPVAQKVDDWKEAQGCRLTKQHADDPELVITDTRPTRVHSNVGLNGIQREVYDFCDRRRSVRAIVSHLAERYALPEDFEPWLREFLEQMVDWRLMIREKDQYLSLAVPAATAA